MALPQHIALVRRALRITLFLLLAIVGAGCLATVCGPRAYRWRAFTVLLGARPALSGQSYLEVPPLGEVHAQTHQAPLALYARLHAVSFDDLKRLALSATPRAELERDLKGFAERSAIDFSLRLLGWGAVGALIAPLLFRSRRAREWLAAPLVGVVLLALVLALTKASFRADAFRKQPTFTGSLEEAPWAISLVQNAVSNTEALGTRLRNVSVNLRALYSRIGQAAADPASDAGTVRILHISDIHNNPAAISFVRDLAAKFEVAAVIDTGDLSDFGTPMENQAAQGLSGLKELGVPYVFVAGNHDSEATMRAVETTFGGTVLRAGAPPLTVAGLTIIGSADPAALRPAAGSVDTPPEALGEAGEALLKDYQEASPAPDIVCVHNPRQAAPLQGTAPLILCGHMHTPSIVVEKGTVLCNAGTTGAAGGRYFERAEGVPFSAAILHFSPPKPGTRPRLLFIDQVQLQGSLREYSITRRGFSNQPTPEEANETPQSSPPP